MTDGERDIIFWILLIIVVFFILKSARIIP